MCLPLYKVNATFRYAEGKLRWDLAQPFPVTTLIIISLEKDIVPNGRSLSSHKGLALNINIIHETGLETTHTISKSIFSVYGDLDTPA